jgi:ABC transporter substrate binding protein
MRRREFLSFLSGATVALPCLARAQQQQNIPRLCFLTFDPGTLQTRSPRFDEFFLGLQDLGYVQGRNIWISYLSADNKGDRFPSLIDECLALKPNVIAVTTTPAAHLLKKATRTIPIVMVALGDPVGTGLVDSLSRPSENITGMSLMVPEMAVKRLELVKELLPGISRVLVLSFLADPIAPVQVKAMERAAGSLGLTLQVQDIRTVDDIPVAFEAASRGRAEGAGGGVGRWQNRLRLDPPLEFIVQPLDHIGVVRSDAIIFWALLASGQINMRKVDG